MQSEMHNPMPRWSAMLAAAVLVAGSVLTGCAAQPNMDVLSAAQSGDMSFARVRLQDKIGKQFLPRPTASEQAAIEAQRARDERIELDPTQVDREYVLDRARLLSLMMGDGYNDYAEPVALELNRLLRTQGLNSSLQAASVLLNEDVKVWKGEPFEQAMAMTWIGMHFAMRGDWDNARTASDNALFQLRDFGTYPSPTGPRRYDNQTLAAAMAANQVSDEDQPSDTGYQLVESNFVLGYLMTAIANQQLGREAEAQDNYAKALRYDPSLDQLVEHLRQGEYNTIFVVEYATGPQKIGTGPDGAIAQFRPMFTSDRAPLIVTSDPLIESFPVAMDVNAIATDLMWNNLEDVRIAKSTVGSLLVGAGAFTAAYGDANDDDLAAIIGLAAIATGALIKSQSYADTRYNEAVPQRVYLATATVRDPYETFTFQIQGKPSSRLVVTGLEPPSGIGTQLQYLRLPASVFGSPAPWQLAERALYANVHDPTAGAIRLPYIMGGHCVLPPSDFALRRYQAAGYLLDYTLADLENLYLVEGIVWEYPPGALPGLHVLDGGNSLVAPQPGTTGYARLFGSSHPPYFPKSETLSKAIASLPPFDEPIAQPQAQAIRTTTTITQETPR